MSNAIETEVRPMRRIFQNPLWLVLGVVLPAAVALGFVYRFGVNVPAHDEWNFMPTVRAFYGGGDWVPQVLEHYSEHRVVLLKLIILGLGRLTRLNVKVEMYLSALLMALSALLCWLLIRRTGWPPWAIVPVGWLLLSTAQYENLLVGWQLAIPLMNVFVLLAVLLLSASPPRLLAAAAAGIGATFSFASGMLIWPSGFCLLFVRYRRLRPLLVWTLVGGASVIAYRIGYHGTQGVPEGYLLSILRQPTDALNLFLALLGNSFGRGTPGLSTLAGGVLVALIAVGTFVLRRWDRLRETDAPWYALLMFSAVSAFAVSLGRAFAWQAFVSASRYVTVTIFVPVAAVMIAIRAGLVLWCSVPRARLLVGACSGLLLVVGAWQAFRTAQIGWSTGAADRAVKERAVPCLIEYRTASAQCLHSLYAPDAEVVRSGAAVLEQWGLGPFADAPAAGEVRGNVDQVEGSAISGAVTIPGGSKVLVEGWALAGVRSPAAVILSVDGTWKAITSRFLPRPDVGEFFHQEVADCGWQIELPAAGLAAGEHRLEALALPQGSESLHPLASIKLIVLPNDAAGEAAQAQRPAPR
jgi:hypothetical protein